MVFHYSTDMSYEDIPSRCYLCGNLCSERDTYVIHSSNIPTISKYHHLIFCVCLSIFPAINRYRTRLRSILFRHMKDLTPRRKDVVAFALLTHGPRISLDIWK
jgi:hypothetical protein